MNKLYILRLQDSLMMSLRVFYKDETNNRIITADDRKDAKLFSYSEAENLIKSIEKHFGFIATIEDAN